MRFNLTLAASGTHNVLPCNYQYPLSAAIYKIIQHADGGYAAFLHDNGYRLENGKTFKLFTFSDIRTPFRNQEDRLLMTTGKATLLACFHIPQAAENFIRGLFMHQQLEVADSKSKVVFQVEQVETVADLPGPGIDDGSATIILRPLSPLVAGMKNESGKYEFMPPSDSSYNEQIRYHLIEKYQSVSPLAAREKEMTRERVSVAVQFFKQPPKSRLITIKAGTPAQTKVRGFTNFRLQVKAPVPVLELALNAGIGLYGSMGMGCVEQWESSKLYKS